MMIASLILLSLQVRADDFLCPCMEHAIMTDEYLVCSNEYAKRIDRIRRGLPGPTAEEMLSEVYAEFRAMRRARLQKRDHRASDSPKKQMPEEQGQFETAKAVVQPRGEPTPDKRGQQEYKVEQVNFGAPAQQPAQQPEQAPIPPDLRPLGGKRDNSPRIDNGL
jgi:hypothetical protein